MKSKLKTQRGFSLVELMVVVAIIGVLATIAIPRVNRFIAKSRQSEAQINLSSIYTFNKNFFLEYQGYTTAFDAMGYRPEGDLRYNSGFSQAATGPTNYTTLTTLAYAGDTNTLARCPLGGGAGCRTLRGADNNAPPGITRSDIAADFSTFTAEATACLVIPAAGGACVADAWTINQDKTVVNAQRGIE